jgi:peroxiredoxin
MADTIDAPNWSDIPAPTDDGATDHLSGERMPSVPLAATSGPAIDLSKLRGRTVLYAYPRTGRPGVANPEGWDMIPGARGCTPQSCAFRDEFAELRRLGVERVFGLSTQDRAYQREAADRLQLPFVLLSDSDLKLTQALQLPIFETNGMTLLKRFTLVIDDGTITHVFYPVFPPDQSARVVIAWLEASHAPAPPSTTSVSEPLIDEAMNDPSLPRIPGTTATPTAGN